MVYPNNNNTDYHDFTYYQGIIYSELICTVALFVFLQIFHYCVWGHVQEKIEMAQQEGTEVAKVPEEDSELKWDQRAWNVYFPVIFGNHIASVFLPLLYMPNTFACVAAYVHFVGFCGMLINTIFIREEEPGQGGRTKSNRIFWVIMCLCNLALIVGGLVGIPTVIR